MATKKKASSKQPAPDWMSVGTAVELSEVDSFAHSIVTDRPDLMPSVRLIMTSDLEGDGRLKALTLFNTALSTPGDANRDPRVAIDRCGSPSSRKATS